LAPRHQSIEENNQYIFLLVFNIHTSARQVDFKDEHRH